MYGNARLNERMLSEYNQNTRNEKMKMKGDNEEKIKPKWQRNKFGLDDKSGLAFMGVGRLGNVGKQLDDLLYNVQTDCLTMFRNVLEW